MLEKLKRAAERAAEGSVLETHPHYRTAIGFLGVALPPFLMLWAKLHNERAQNSISAYYFTAGRDEFVGVLWVIGVFLFFYRFRPRDPTKARAEDPIQSGKLDAWLGKAAGASAVLVALVPTTPPAGTSATQPPTIGMFHGIFAAALFICLSLFPLVLFSRSEKRKRLYQAYGWSMLGILALIAVYAYLPDSSREALASWRPVFFLEWALITVFGVSWFQKGWELANLEKS